MRQIEKLTHLYNLAVNEITQSSEAWMNYLRFAASIYKYSFDNTLLIYMQNPKATMLAPLSLWNQIDRRVNKGAKSIAVCDFGQDIPKINHLFDVTQTNGRTLPLLWNMDAINQVELAGRLTSYDSDRLEAAIANLAKEATLSSSDYWLQDIELDHEDRSLAYIPMNGLEQHIQDLVQDSIRFIVHCRCKLPELEDVDFSTITHFNSLPSLARLGYQVNTLSRELLQDIARHIKIIEQERSITHEQERQHHTDNVSGSRRIALSQSLPTERRGSELATARTLRQNSTELSERPSSSALSNPAHAGESDEQNAPSRTGSTTEDGATNPTTSEVTSSSSDRQHLETNTPLEPNQDNSRGTRDERHPVQSEITESSASKEPPSSGSFLFIDEDIKGSHTADEMLECLLQNHEIIANIKSTIYQIVTNHYPIKSTQLASQLKTMYGIGGARGKFEQGLTGYDYSNKGISLEWLDGLGKHQSTFTWNKVADTILNLIREGRYAEHLTPFPAVEQEWTLFNFMEETETQPSEQNLHPEPSTTQSNIASSSSVPVASNYRFDPAHSPYVSGPKSKFKRNVAAIRLLKQLEVEQRQATPVEQHILAGYVGWGGLANAFQPKTSGWEHEYAELKQLLDENEYANARNSTITAFYTEQAIIRPIHDTLTRFGLTDGTNRKLLEPSMGTGNFFSVLPPQWEQAELHGVELDDLTGRIARQLYPSVNTHLQGFETVKWNNTRFDAIFSNIPFHNIRIMDQRYKSNYLIHDYFFIRSMDLLKPGGILAFIVSKGTLDKQDNMVRKLLAEQAELIGAVRLPNTTFQSLAGATVTTDIVFLQKCASPQHFNEGEWPEWTEIGQTADGVPINRYYLSHPEQLLGAMVWDRGMYGAEQTTACVPNEGQELISSLENALHRLQATLPPASTPSIRPTPLSNQEQRGLQSYPAPAGTKNYTYIIEGTRIYYCENGQLLLQDFKGTKAERIKGLCEIRIALLEVIGIQSQDDGYDEHKLQQAQHQLNQVYDRFIRSYGSINDRSNIQAFADDDQLPLLRSIEDATPEKTWIKAAIFTRPTIRPNRLPEHTDSALEALQICLNQRLVTVKYF